VITVDSLPDKSDVESRLTERDREAILKRLGFDFSDSREGKSGWTQNVYGPPELGEGENPNFAVQLSTGAVHDHGNGPNGYSEDFWNTVQDLNRCGFREAIEFVCKQAGIQMEKTKAEETDWKPYKGIEVERYPYRDGDGTLLYHRVRFRPPEGIDNPDRPKKFLPNTPGESGWGRGPDPVLYRLPEVQREAEKGEDGAVFVVEGEKDVHALESAEGFPYVATTSGSAGSWRDRFAENLEGANVVVIPDNDSDGMDYAESVAESCHPVAESVRIVELNDVPAGGDVSDWLGRDHTAEELLEEVAETEEWTPADSLTSDVSGDGQASGTPELSPPEGEEDKAKDETQAQTLIRLADPADLWTTPDGDCYATFPVSGHEETAPLRQKPFRQWLRHRFYKKRGKPPGSQALQDAIDTLAAEARFEGDVAEAHLRVAGDSDEEKRIYVDLGNESWEAMEITPEGWERSKSVDPNFRRVPSMNELPAPTESYESDPQEALNLLRDHVRVKDDGNFSLLLAWLVQALRPCGPYPVLVFTGEHGSGKSMTTKMIRSLVDPSSVPTATAPKSEEDLIVTAENSWVLNIDNMSDVSPWLSDSLCRLATGGGFRTRKLYSNKEEVYFYHQRPMILNGIEKLTDRPDLADRALRIELDAIPEDEVDSEKDVWRAFEEDRPHIVAGLFSAASVALECIDNVDLPTLPRMADFAKWAAAAEPAFPVDPGTFRDSYATNRKQANQNTLENDEVARAIQALVEDAGRWHGKMSELVEDLKPYIFNPDSPPPELQHYNSLSSHLKRIMPVLRDAGIRRKDDEAKRSRAFSLYHEDQVDGDASDPDALPF